VNVWLAVALIGAAFMAGWIARDVIATRPQLYTPARDVDAGPEAPR
jgi:hypothetical protein